MSSSRPLAAPGEISFILLSHNRGKKSAQRKEVKGSEEDGELDLGSRSVNGLFLGMCGGLQGNQIEMSKVWSGFHS